MLRLAQPNSTPKALMAAVRKEHPDASKKDVVRAAFFAILSHADEDIGRAGRLHDFALSERKDNAPEQAD